jgi:hypothetical protein
MKTYMSLNYASDDQQVMIHNEFGPVAVVAKLRDGRWHVDMSEVERMEISSLASELENQLQSALNSRASNEELNVLFNDLRRTYNV